MSINTWLKKNTSDLSGKTVAVTGSTGGLGRALCHHLASLGASLILMDRNAKRSEALRDELIEKYGIAVRCIGADMADFPSVRRATASLIAAAPDVLICNAGAYSIPRHICQTGYDNVFQINFVSPYYMISALLPTLRRRGGRAVIVGSIAHNYSKTDPEDIDFSTRTAASKVYGNAKRHLMFALAKKFADESEATLAITHPGISFTGITAHYPKWIFALIKHPMKLIFMKPPRASLSILQGVFDHTDEGQWIGPCFFDIWGLPKKKRLHTASAAEIDAIYDTAERILAALPRDDAEKY